MPKKLMTRDEFLDSSSGKEDLAMMVLLLKEAKQQIGKMSWADAALYATDVAKMLGVEDEFDRALKTYPKIKVGIERDVLLKVSDGWFELHIDGEKVGEHHDMLELLMDHLPQTGLSMRIEYCDGY